MFINPFFHCATTENPHGLSWSQKGPPNCPSERTLGNKEPCQVLSSSKLKLVNFPKQAWTYLCQGQIPVYTKNQQPSLLNIMTTKKQINNLF